MSAPTRGPRGWPEPRGACCGLRAATSRPLPAEPPPASVAASSRGPLPARGEQCVLTGTGTWRLPASSQNVDPWRAAGPRAEAHAGSCVCEERQKLEREPSPQGLGCQRRGRPQRPSGPRGSMSTHRLLCPRLVVLLLRRAGSVRFVPVVSLGADPAWAGLGLNMQETVDRGPGRAGPGAGSGGRACAWAASASYPRPGTERGQGRVRRPWGVRLSGNRVVALRPVVVVRPLCRGREGEAVSFAGGAGA